MKKIITTLSILLLSLNIFASEYDNNEKPWDLIGVSFIPGIPSSANNSNIGGIRIGIPIAGGQNKVCGLEFAIFCCMSQELYGVQFAPLFCTADDIYGVQASPVTVANKVKGLQFGLFNYSDDASFQIGIINYNKSSILPIFPIINFHF